MTNDWIFQIPAIPTLNPGTSSFTTLLAGYSPHPPVYGSLYLFTNTVDLTTLTNRMPLPYTSARVVESQSLVIRFTAISQGTCQQP